MKVVHVLIPAQQFEKLDRPRRPAGDVVREQLEQGERSLAATIPDRVRHFAPRNQDAIQRAAFGCRVIARLARVGYRTIANQIRDVGHRPVFGSFDEPIFVKLPNVVLDHVHLFGDHAKQGLQCIVLPGIAHPVNGG